MEHLHLPPTPPSSHSSDSEGSLSPNPRLHPFGPPQAHSPARAAVRAPSALSSSPLLTAPHVSIWLASQDMSPSRSVACSFTQNWCHSRPLDFYPCDEVFSFSCYNRVITTLENIFKELPLTSSCEPSSLPFSCARFQFFFTCYVAVRMRNKTVVSFFSLLKIVSQIFTISLGDLYDPQQEITCFLNKQSLMN